MGNVKNIFNKSGYDQEEAYFHQQEQELINKWKAKKHQRAVKETDQNTAQNTPQSTPQSTSQNTPQKTAQKTPQKISESQKSADTKQKLKRSA